MTSEFSKRAIDALNDADLKSIVNAFTLAKVNATYARVPHAAHWQLDHQPGHIAAWRVVDRKADPGPDGTGNTAIALRATTIPALHLELVTYGLTLQGIEQIRRARYSEYLMAPTRQRPRS
jgi:hypothetical protein